MKTMAKWAALLAALMMLLLAVPFAGVAEVEGCDFQITCDGYYEYITEGVETPELYVEKGATVTITPVYDRLPNAENESIQWTFWDWDAADSKGEVVCTEKAYTFTFARNGNLDFLTEFKHPDSDVWTNIYSNIYVQEYINPFAVTGTVGSLVTIYPFSNEVTWDKYGIENSTMEELNANLTVTASVGKGLKILSENYKFETFYEGGMEWYDMPCMFLQILSKEADGEKVTFTITDKRTGSTDKYEFTMELNGIVRGAETIVSELPGVLKQNEYGNYVLNVQSGGDLTITTNYTTFDGKPADVIVEWRITDDQGYWTTDEPVHVGSSYTFKNIKTGYSYQWDVSIKEDHTHVDTLWVYVDPPVLEVEIEDKLVVTPELIRKGLDTPQKIQTEIETTIYADALKQWPEVPAENVASYEVALYQYMDGEKIKVTKENWPEDLKQLTVQLPYPAGSGPEDEFIVTHMFATSVNGKVPGTYEYPAVRKFNEYLEFEVTGLSPIAVAWRNAPAAAAVPSTGDSATPCLWMLGMLVAAAGCVMLVSKRRQNG